MRYWILFAGQLTRHARRRTLHKAQIEELRERYELMEGAFVLRVQCLGEADPGLSLTLHQGQGIEALPRQRSRPPELDL